jgi:hypothetical protein
MGKKEETQTEIEDASPAPTADRSQAEMEDLSEQLVALHGKRDALIGGMNRGYLSVDFIQSMIAKGAETKQALEKDSCIVLEFLRRAGVVLKTKGNLIARNAAKGGRLHALEYLIKEVQVPPSTGNYALFATAIERTDLPMLSLLLSSLEPDDTDVWSVVGDALVEKEWWDGMQRVYWMRGSHFERLVKETDLLRVAAKAGARELAFQALAVSPDQHAAVAFLKKAKVDEATSNILKTLAVKPAPAPEPPKEEPPAAVVEAPVATPEPVAEPEPEPEKPEIRTSLLPNLPANTF